MAHEFDGRKYEKASAHQKEWGAKLISELSLNGNEHVLDLGCGDGTNTAFRQYVIEEMIQETRQSDGKCFETFRRINLFAKK